MAFDSFKKPIGAVTGVPAQAQKLVTAEPFELVRTAQKQVLPHEKLQPPSSTPTDTRGTEQSVPTPQEITEEGSAARKRMEELRQELEVERQKLEEKGRRWEQQQQELMTPSPEEKLNTPFEPTTKPKQGLPPGFVRKKQGTKEVGKQI